jgi:hypothetical protein
MALASAMAFAREPLSAFTNVRDVGPGLQSSAGHHSLPCRSARGSLKLRERPRIGQDTGPPTSVLGPPEVDFLGRTSARARLALGERLTRKYRVTEHPARDVERAEGAISHGSLLSHCRIAVAPCDTCDRAI